jgi:hypothetical protein
VRLIRVILVGLFENLTRAKDRLSVVVVVTILLTVVMLFIRLDNSATGNRHRRGLLSALVLTLLVLTLLVM